MEVRRCGPSPARRTTRPGRADSRGADGRGRRGVISYLRDGMMEEVQHWCNCIGARLVQLVDKMSPFKKSERHHDVYVHPGDVRRPPSWRGRGSHCAPGCRGSSPDRIRGPLIFIIERRMPDLWGGLKEHVAAFKGRSGGRADIAGQMLNLFPPKMPKIGDKWKRLSMKCASKEFSPFVTRGAIER